MQQLLQGKDSSFYIQDCSYFRDAIGVEGHHVMESDGHFLCATVSLFQLHSDGRLYPLAIVIDFKWLLSAQLPWLLSFRVAEENNLLSYASSLWNLYRQKATPDGKRTAEIAKTFYNKLRELITVFQDHSEQMTKSTIPYTVTDPHCTAISILI